MEKIVWTLEMPLPPNNELNMTVATVDQIDALTALIRTLVSSNVDGPTTLTIVKRKVAVDSSAM